MKHESIRKAFDLIPGILALLVGKLAFRWNPQTQAENIFIVILIISLLFIYVIGPFCFQDERRSVGRLDALVNNYGSFWMLVLFVSLINLIGEQLQWPGIGIKYTLYLVFAISIVGYIRDIRSRSRYRSIIIAPYLIGDDDSPILPYNFEKPTDKKT
jgi:MFS family permease